jgi:hypothetical protein
VGEGFEARESEVVESLLVQKFCAFVLGEVVDGLECLFESLDVDNSGEHIGNY